MLLNGTCALCMIVGLVQRLHMSFERSLSRQGKEVGRRRWRRLDFQKPDSVYNNPVRKKNARAAALLRDLEWRYAHLLPFESHIFGVNRVVLVRCRLSPPAELRALFNRSTV